MRAIRALSVVGAGVLAVAIVAAFAGGDFAEEGRRILALPWGLVSIVDIYTGAVFVAAWIGWRDGWRAGAVWVVMLVVWGHLATAAYVAWRAWTTDTPVALLIGRDRS